ncbi:ferrochelatase [Arcanobacterium pinnipediorum]|uniref:Coproporphyrin III ferrochelatase n=1 Tax=Arcanobacterium pinnipediorum TaxID=1503041 RepID=A0ABY5AG90_9ACTO|nr:ferrochelatase [Arcanobacterium pinnipediorum]USR78882.1 ferrochelatase [Arcanobacterium pinnipediorum]
MKRGCLIVALGTPASPNPEDIRTFLRSFLSDPAVVDMPRWLWKPILNQIVLRVRPKKIAPTYQSIWTSEGSPLLIHTRAQAHHLAAQLEGVKVGFATTYTQPSIAAAIDELDVDELVIIPLYPQYAPSTVADIWRQVDIIESQPGSPRIIRAQAWYGNSRYISWYARKVRDYVKSASTSIDKLVLSYHGVPQRKVHQPQLYQAQCEATTASIIAALNDHGIDIAWETTYQSKFGPGKWLQPATIERMAELPGEGVHNILVLTPGFFASCIETLDEILVLNREAFVNAGGKDFHLISPPDSDPEAGKILADIYRQSRED